MQSQQADAHHMYNVNCFGLLPASQYAQKIFALERLAISRVLLLMYTANRTGHCYV
jgi:hypothetical protein